MSQSTQDQIIIMSLQPMFEQAEAENLWFYHESDGEGEVWASPRYLHQEHAEGRLIWSPEHWILRSPLDYMASLHQKASSLVDEYNDLAEILLMPHILLREQQNMTPAARIAKL